MYHTNDIWYTVFGKLTQHERLPARPVCVQWCGVVDSMCRRDHTRLLVLNKQYLSAVLMLTRGPKYRRAGGAKYDHFPREILAAACDVLHVGIIRYMFANYNSRRNGFGGMLKRLLGSMYETADRIEQSARCVTVFLQNGYAWPHPINVYNAMFIGCVEMMEFLIQNQNIRFGFDDQITLHLVRSARMNRMDIVHVILKNTYMCAWCGVSNFCRLVRSHNDMFDALLPWLERKKYARAYIKLDTDNYTGNVFCSEHILCVMEDLMPAAEIAAYMDERPEKIRIFECGHDRLVDKIKNENNFYGRVIFEQNYMSKRVDWANELKYRCHPGRTIGGESSIAVYHVKNRKTV